MPDDAPQPDTNKGVIFVVVCTLAVNATVGLTALSYCLVFKVMPDQVLLTAFVSITTGLLGVLGGMLTKTSPTETTKQVSVSNQPVVTDDTKPKTP
jgi:hypothetical protein